jgi:hypothetical protein
MLDKSTYKGKIEENFLFCQPLEGRTTGNYIFILIKFFLKTYEIPWSMYVSLFRCSCFSKKVQKRF